MLKSPMWDCHQVWAILPSTEPNLTQTGSLLFPKEDMEYLLHTRRKIHVQKSVPMEMSSLLSSSAKLSRFHRPHLWSRKYSPQNTLDSDSSLRTNTPQWVSWLHPHQNHWKSSPRRLNSQISQPGSSLGSQSRFSAWRMRGPASSCSSAAQRCFFQGQPLRQYTNSSQGAALVLLVFLL